ncbi:uncharacterized protein [Dermacentor albipictus]|uniref:uncharacterized protein isoform X2 n=1 Tax=Dermacentor albipictus TaxID=60249 RepID=UPI0031FCC1E8
MGDEQGSGGDENYYPVAPAGQANSTAGLADAAPVAPAALVPATETSAFPLLVGIAAILTVGVIAIALTWYLLKETPAVKEPPKPLTITKKLTPVPPTLPPTLPTPSPAALPTPLPPTLPPALPTTVAPVIGGPPMICTNNIDKFSLVSVLPSDGLCDQIYLDSVCRKSPCNTGAQWTVTGVIKDFLEVANATRTSNKRTRLGLAFDSHASHNLLIFSNGVKRKQIIEDLWSAYNCSHYASLQNNIRAFSDPDKASGLWNPLLSLRRHLESLSGVQDDFGLVLGVTSTDIPSMVEKVLEDYNRMPPSLTNFIIISHTSFDNYALPPYNDKASFDLTNCYIVPPTIHNYSSHYNQTYYGTLEDSSTFLQELLTASLKVPVSVSVTLKGRWFTSNAPIEENREIFKKCAKLEETTDAPPDSMCAYKERVKNLKFSFAVYDIDADQKDTACDKVKYTGQYKRLNLLRKLINFMEKYTNKKDCESVS